MLLLLLFVGKESSRGVGDGAFHRRGRAPGDELLEGAADEIGPGAGAGEDREPSKCLCARHSSGAIRRKGAVCDALDPGAASAGGAGPESPERPHMTLVDGRLAICESHLDGPADDQANDYHDTRP